MKIIKTNLTNPTKETIDFAAKTMQKGGIIMYPTDTCYGLGADISNRYAFNKIYKIKKRSTNKPVSIILKDIKQIQNIAILENWQKPYLEKYMPGSVTFIFLTLNQDIFPFSSVGIRIPNFLFTMRLSDKFKYPYITTSANIADYPQTYSVKDFINQLDKNDPKPDLILDAGKLKPNPPSTVVDMTKNPPKILRQGNTIIKKMS